MHKCLSDILEDEVDEKYYLTRKQIEAILFSNYNVTKNSIHERGGPAVHCAPEIIKAPSV